VKDQVGPTTLIRLTPPEDAKLLIGQAVVRTRDLELLFAGPEFTIVRTDGKYGAVYSLAKDTIRALGPCVEVTK
jgi:hypothetical protein